MTTAVNKFPSMAGISKEFAREDHKHTVDTSAPVALSASENKEGHSTFLARADHVHSHGDLPGGKLHHPATKTVSGFMSKEDKCNLEDLVGGEPRRVNNLAKFQLINTFKALFSTHAHGVVMPELVPNIIKFDQFVTDAKISEKCRVDLTGNGVALTVTGDIVSMHDSAGDGVRSAQWTQESALCSVAGSGDNVNIVSACTHGARVYAAKKEWASPSNWEMYSSIMLNMSTESHTAAVLLSIKSNGKWQQASIRPFESNGTVKNLAIELPEDRNAVTGFVVGIYDAECAEEILTKVTDLRFVRGEYGMAQDGYLVTDATEYSTDIIDLIICDNRTFPLDLGKITVDVSLDGGAHWATNVTHSKVLDAFGGDLSFADGGIQWAGKRSLKLRYRFEIGDDEVSPILNDYLVIVSRA